MQASIDISMYPLTEQYCQPIIDFIESLEKHDEVRIARNAMSTQIFGDYKVLMNALTEEVEAVLLANPKTVFILKLMGSDRSKANIFECSGDDLPGAR